MQEIRDLISQNKPEEAHYKLMPLIEENPDNADGWFLLGLIQLLRKDDQWATESFKKAFTLDKNHAEALFHYGNLLRNHADAHLQNEARGAFKAAQKIDPTIRIPNSVYIGIPHYGHSDQAFEESFDAMVGYIKMGDNIDWMSCRCEGSRITSNRNRLVQDAMQKHATHILFIDSDMDFPPDSLHRLLAHDKDIVCATTCKRGDENGIPIGQAVDDGAGGTHRRITTGTGLVEMKAVGSCFMLIKLEVFDKVRLPAFYEPPEYSIGDAIGEDITFCGVVRKAGFKIWLDVGLSFQLGHWGRKRYSIKSLG